MYKKVILLILIALVLVGCGTIEEDAIESDVTIEIWSFSDDLEKPIETFEEEKNIAVELTVLDVEDYELKVKEVLESKKDLPDLIVSDDSWVKKWINEDYFITLESSKYEEALIDYVYYQGQDQEGRLKAISWHVNPTALIYKKQIAQEVWGNDQSDFIANKFSTHDTIIEAAKELKEANYKTFPSVDSIKWFYDLKPWLSPENELGFHQENIEFIDYKKAFVDHEYTALAPEFSPAYFQSINGAIPYDAGWNDVSHMTEEQYNVFGYVLPKWGLDYVIRPNSDDEMNEWGLASIGDPINRGGSYLSIVKASENVAEAKMFVEMMVLDEEFLETWHMQTKELLSNKNITYTDDDYLKNQDSYEFYFNEALQLSESRTSQYNYEFNQIYDRLSQEYILGETTKDEMIRKYIDILENNYDIIEN